VNSSASLLARHLRRRRIALLAGCGLIIVVLTAVLFLAASTTMSGFTSRIVAGAAASPTVADGVVDADAPLTVDDDDHPAMTRLDPALRDALRAAQAAASADGITFDITSGWRSDGYQRWLLADAVRTYGSRELAEQYVAAPEVSSHVTGHAVDIGPLDAQLWLADHGREWGLCQTYANERWHFERATDAGGECPTPHLDARG
jgi:hypothetical protein